MSITLEPFVRITCFNFCLKALDYHFHPVLTAGTSDPYRRQNSLREGQGASNTIGRTILIHTVDSAAFVNWYFTFRFSMQQKGRVRSPGRVTLMFLHYQTIGEIWWITRDMNSSLCISTLRLLVIPVTNQCGTCSDHPLHSSAKVGVIIKIS